MQKEVCTMGQTMAEALREEGRLEGERKGRRKAKRDALILQLRKKFGEEIPSIVVAKISRTSNLRQLDEWLIKILDAKTLKDVGIPLKS
jgi:hypothetical protein